MHVRANRYDAPMRDPFRSLAERHARVFVALRLSHFMLAGVAFACLAAGCEDGHSTSAADATFAPAYALTLSVASMLGNFWLKPLQTALVISSHCSVQLCQ